MLGEHPWPEIAVDHPHRRVAEHQGENSSIADVGHDLVGSGLRLRRYRSRVVQLVLRIADLAGRTPLVEPGHERLVLGPIRRRSPDSREAPAQTLEARPGVEQGNEAWPGARKVAGEQERVVLADDAV